MANSIDKTFQILRNVSFNVVEKTRPNKGEKVSTRYKKAVILMRTMDLMLNRISLKRYKELTEVIF
jgi:hypothetical protein